MTPENGTSDALPIRQYLAVLRSRKWNIILIAGLTLAVALAFSYRMRPIYSSTARVLVKPINAQQQLQGAGTASEINLDTEQQLVESTSVAEIAGRIMKFATSPRNLLHHVSATAVPNTQILDVTYTDPSPVIAQRGADAFARAYIEFKTQQALGTYTTVRSALGAQIQTLQTQLTQAQDELRANTPGTTAYENAQTEINSLTGQIAVLQSQVGSLNGSTIDPGQIFQPADLPTSPSSPNHSRNAALALFVGLALGIGLAFLRERLDDRLRGRTDLEEHLGAPVLGVIPKVTGWRKKQQAMLVTGEEPKSAASEAYRTLRTSVQFMAAQRGLKVLLVTSPSAGEGKTTTVANLGAVLAQAGRRVILVSADLRKPRLSKFFQLGDMPIENRLGLVNVLADEVPLEKAMRGMDMLKVLPSGPIPTRPAELLQSEQMGELLDQLREQADFILIDSAPALVVADALALAPRADGVLLVANAESTHRGAVSSARQQLDQVGANVVGAVLNDLDVSKPRSHPYAYTYGYRYGYRYEPMNGEPEKNGGGLLKEEQGQR